jgi:hypothetical protein
VNIFIFFLYTYYYQELMIQIPSSSKAPWRPALRILLRSKSAPFLKLTDTSEMDFTSYLYIKKKNVVTVGE